MDEEHNALEWAVDAFAALTFAAAVTWAATLIFAPTTGAAAGSGAFFVILAALRLLARGPERYSLSSFAPESWNQLLASAATEPRESLALVRAGSNVVPFAPVQPPLPTAGEMRERIDQHLRQRQAVGGAELDDDVVLLGADASAALRRAIGELKRSLR
jgi:hypothetical protein